MPKKALTPFEWALKNGGPDADMTPVPTRPAVERAVRKEQIALERTAKRQGLRNADDAKDAISAAYAYLWENLSKYPTIPKEYAKNLDIILLRTAQSRARNIQRSARLGLGRRRLSKKEIDALVAKGEDRAEIERAELTRATYVSSFEEDFEEPPEGEKYEGAKGSPEAALYARQVSDRALAELVDRSIARIPDGDPVKDVLILWQMGSSDNGIAKQLGISKEKVAALREEGQSRIDKMLLTERTRIRRGELGALGGKRDWIGLALMAAAAGSLLWLFSRKNRES